MPHLIKANGKTFQVQTIDESFSSFIVAAYGSADNTSHAQFVDLRRAFYGGVQHAINMLSSIADLNLPEQSESVLVDAMMTEVDHFVRGLTTGKS